MSIVLDISRSIAAYEMAHGVRPHWIELSLAGAEELRPHLQYAMTPEERTGDRFAGIPLVVRPIPEHFRLRRHDEEFRRIRVQRC